MAKQICPVMPRLMATYMCLVLWPNSYTGGVSEVFPYFGFDFDTDFLEQGNLIVF